jgi:uncharacterized protein YjeT (DUF2065 family)
MRVAFFFLAVLTGMFLFAMYNARRTVKHTGQQWGTDALRMFGTVEKHDVWIGYAIPVLTCP